MWRQAGAHGISKNVIAMRFVIRRIADAMISRLGLPNSAQAQFTSRRSGVPALDVLHGLLQRNPLLGSNEQMEMVGHDHELVKFEFTLAAIEVKRVDQEFGGGCVAEKCMPSVGDGCDEKRADFLRSMGHI